MCAGAPSEALRAQHPVPTRITWADLAPFHQRLQAAGLTAATFGPYVEDLRQSHVRRVREGDLDHLVFYMLQSTRFTTQPPIEPALSAKALVDSLTVEERETFLRDGEVAPGRIPPAVRLRVGAFVRAVQRRSGDARLGFFRALVESKFPDGHARELALRGEYVRAMRFVYEKEFVAQRSAGARDAVAELYRTRGLSTDTALEAGFLVHEGLGIVKSLDASRRVRRVLILGPGLDLAPRTALLDERAPESYQPWAVIDALAALGLSRLDDLTVVAADINPRVVAHLRRAAGEPPVLTLVSEIRETATVTLSPEYRDYFARLGTTAGEVVTGMAGARGETGTPRKTVRIPPATARILRAESLDVVTERLAEPPFDLVVATNILPYFDDRELMLALANVDAMLARGGVFLHNEARPAMHDLTTALGLPFEQSRHVIIANVRGAKAPLFDSVFIHRKGS